MCPLARDVKRAIIANRRLQAERNAEAMAEEHERQEELRSGPKMRRLRARRNKMLASTPPEDKIEADIAAIEDALNSEEPVEVDAEEDAPDDRTPTGEAPTGGEEGDGGDLPADGLPAFASAQAEALAGESGMISRDLDGWEPSSNKGFTVADVRARLADMESDK